MDGMALVDYLIAAAIAFFMIGGFIALARMSKRGSGGGSGARASSGRGGGAGTSGGGTENTEI